MRVPNIFFVVAWAATSTCYSAPNPQQRYNLAPSSRLVKATGILRTSGNVTYDATAKSAADQTFTLSGPNATITYDFGQMTAGFPTILFKHATCRLGLAFSESLQGVGYASDLSVLYSHVDGTLYIPMAKGSYSVPIQWARGSFRYLTLSLGHTTSPNTRVKLQLSHVYFTAQPNNPRLNDYTGYFHSSDDLLNQIWYAGAYTIQLSTVSANSSIQRSYLGQASGWANNAQAKGLGPQDVLLTDGAKRDRNGWAGDLAVATNVALVSNNKDNLASVRNALKTCFILQDATTGYFPYAGSPFGDFFLSVGAGYISDTYNLWTIAGFAEYILLSGDTAFGNQYWDQIVRSVHATYAYVDFTTGLFNGTKGADWGRIGQGGENTALNALYYHVLNLLARVSKSIATDSEEVSKWLSMAAKIKYSVNNLLYDEQAGLFFDNTTTAGRYIYPQDGNVAAIRFNLTLSSSQAANIAKNLSKRLTKFGAPAPELPGAISPFMGSLEVDAQFLATPGDASRALALIRTQWRYMMQAFSNSTFIEGYGSDGSLTYPFYPGGSTFISHAHAWSTGPTYSLMNRLVGLIVNPLEINSADGAWVFRPCVRGSGVSFANGGFKTFMGSWSAGWKVEGRRLSGSIKVPSGLSGTLYIPVSNGRSSVKVDGSKVKTTKLTGGFVRIPNVAGGTHTFEVLK
ncbi:Six-hairpin glycosidase-like protein [Cadophora sp. MPI-SDFR-AT-0126]|nr:Six-hairpin glycosidase-like protein [Leotiomycetes sp. MPI-SDFR-AT-0126]